MVRVALSLVVVLAASAALSAADQKKGQTVADPKAVVVDPMDLRQPVPDPGKELTLKYDGQTVRYTGQLSKVGTDKKRGTHWYELRTEVRTAQQAKDKKAQSAKKEFVTVTVYLQQDDKRLQDPKAALTVTVQGRGEITSEGNLIIRQARVTDLEQKAK